MQVVGKWHVHTVMSDYCSVIVGKGYRSGMISDKIVVALIRDVE